MPDAPSVLEQQFLEMRWRTLSLAADLDRIDRAAGGRQLLSTDPRLHQLREALKILLQNEPERAAPDRRDPDRRGPDRAERVQMIFSDMTPPPPRNPESQI